MSMPRRFLAVALFSAALAASLTVRAEEAAAPAAAPESAAQTETMPMPMMGMGMGNSRCGAGMMAGPGMGQRCNTRKGMAGGAPCMTGGKCPTAEVLEHRIDSLEKRLDMMQTMLEMMARQQGAGN